MFSTTTRMTGLSGLDVEGMVSNLMRAESMKYNNLLKKATLTTYKQEAYRNVAKSLETFQSKFLMLTTSSSALRLKSSFQTRSASVTTKGSSAATTDIGVKAGSSAAKGNYSMTVHQVAQKDQYEVGETISPSIIGSDTGGNFDDLMKSLTDSKGVVSDFTFNMSVDGAAAKAITFTKEELRSMKLLGSDEEIAAKFTENLNTKLEKAFGSETANNSSKGEQKVTASYSKDSGFVISTLHGHSATVTGGESLSYLGIESGAKTTADTSSVKLSDMFGDEAFTDGKFTMSINDEDFAKAGFTKDTTLREFMDYVNSSSNANVNVSISSGTGKLTIEGKSTGAVNGVNIGFADGGDTSGWLKQTSVAQDAIFSFNGGVLTSRETNNFTVEGITFSLNENSVDYEVDDKGDPVLTNGLKTPVAKTFNVTVGADVTDTKKMILDFVNEYNNLVESLNSQYKTSRPKSSTGDFYEPLTDEEQNAMSESQVKSWEEKAKTGMLHQDDIIGNFISQMRTQLTSSVTLADGRSISLSSIGITTSGSIGDGGKLIVDEDKLTKALEERGEDVIELFTKSATDKANSSTKLRTEGLADRLNDVINGMISNAGKISGKAGIEGTSSESNNAMYWDLRNQNDKISQMLTYLQNKEDYYYKMFSKIESAMMQSDDQLASLQAILGS